MTVISGLNCQNFAHNVSIALSFIQIVTKRYLRIFYFKTIELKLVAAL